MEVYAAMTIDLPIIITFGSYLVAMLVIGFFAYRMTNSLDDYVLGGRSLGPSVTALSVGASDMSGWLLLGLPGAIHAAGIGQVWIGVGLVAGAYLNWLLVAAPLRKATELAGDAITIPEYLEYRFKDKSGLIRLTAAILTLVFFTFYVGAGLVGGLFFSKRFLAWNTGRHFSSVRALLSPIRLSAVFSQSAGQTSYRDASCWLHWYYCL